MDQYRITLGGWPAFSQERGVSSKEVQETFDWLPLDGTYFYPKSDRYYLEDCRGALDRVEGAREWLKAYEGVFDSGEMLSLIAAEMSHDHSGSSIVSTLQTYRSLLNDWDDWVYKHKRCTALKAYRAQQPPLMLLEVMINNCRECQAKPDADFEHEINYYCAVMCISGCMTELIETMEAAVDEMRGPPLEDSPPAPAIHYPLLPLGGHLLPPDFQRHLKKWNIEITKKVGDWREGRDDYKKLYPERWAEFREENEHFTELYGEELNALKAYEALYSSQSD